MGTDPQIVKRKRQRYYWVHFVQPAAFAYLLVLHVYVLKIIERTNRQPLSLLRVLRWLAVPKIQSPG